VHATALSAVGKSAQDACMNNEQIEYRGFFIFWRDPRGDDKWMGGIASGCPSLFPATASNKAIDGSSRDDMLGNAKTYVDRLLDHAHAA
jgi:hypothetical protein